MKRRNSLFGPRSINQYIDKLEDEINYFHEEF